ncbi:MAG: hypothetical protein PHH82_04315 [Candidatus ainarchaeum sp.]|nr:hypothetical protein [Candidatus ainarchaeum sp.]
MKLYILIFLFFFLPSVFGLALTPNLELVTTAPETAPYLVGTEINTLRLSFSDINGQVMAPFDKIMVFLDDKKIELYKLDNVYVSNPDLFITSDLVYGGKLDVSLEQKAGYEFSKQKFSFDVEEITDYIDLIKPKIKEIYNFGQKLSLEYTISPYKKDIKNLKMWVLKPGIENGQFSCDGFVCKLSFEIPALDANSMDLFIYGVFTYHGRNIPFIDQYNVLLSDKLDIQITNPEKDGTVNSPFSVDFKVFYANGEEFGNEYGKFVFDGKEETLKKAKDYYFMNYFMFPYISFDHNLEFIYGKSKGVLSTDFSLKPGLWFYLLVGFFIFIFLLETVILLVKKLKKEDLNELIGKRDVYKKKQKDMKKQFLAGAITKSYFDSENEKIEYVLTYLNKKILEIESKEPEELEPIRNKRFTELEKTVAETSEVKEKPVSVAPAVVEKKESFFKKLFKKKEQKEKKFEYKPPKEDKEEKQETGGNIKIENWYK